MTNLMVVAVMNLFLHAAKQYTLLLKLVIHKKPRRGKDVKYLQAALFQNLVLKMTE